MEYQDFGMALATTIVVVLIAVLLRELASGSAFGDIALGLAVCIGWSYGVYLTVDAVKAEALDPYKRSRPLRFRVIAGAGVFVLQLLIGAAYVLI